MFNIQRNQNTGEQSVVLKMKFSSKKKYLSNAGPPREFVGPCDIIFKQQNWKQANSTPKR